MKDQTDSRMGQEPNAEENNRNLRRAKRKNRLQNVAIGALLLALVVVLVWVGKTTDLINSDFLKPEDPLRRTNPEVYDFATLLLTKITAGDAEGLQQHYSNQFVEISGDLFCRFPASGSKDYGLFLSFGGGRDYPDCTRDKVFSEHLNPRIQGLRDEVLPCRIVKMRNKHEFNGERKYEVKLSCSCSGQIPANDRQVLETIEVKRSAEGYFTWEWGEHGPLVAAYRDCAVYRLSDMLTR